MSIYTATTYVKTKRLERHSSRRARNTTQAQGGYVVWPLLPAPVVFAFVLASALLFECAPFSLLLTRPDPQQGMRRMAVAAIS